MCVCLHGRWPTASASLRGDPREPYALQHLAGPRQDLTLAERCKRLQNLSLQKKREKNQVKGPPTTLAKTHAAQPNIIASEDGQILSE